MLKFEFRMLCRSSNFEGSNVIPITFKQHFTFNISDYFVLKMSDTGNDSKI